ncbi:hypothetical protein E3J84_06735 [Candidatus Aerophobetes bacterium]|uniref:Xylose isomerase-like TIM barrel domain-containing protein n=1 Tax=Aerophobetes bacterium TaxID=2030807 RepID=A0A523RQI0_UNCAE|nr:MAG: hypothetical protein E3J84_06735 [Candidatus Aerophobetes bacterium]
MPDRTQGDHTKFLSLHPFRRRAHRLGAKYIRIMSYPNDNWSKSDWGKETMKRLTELARIAKKKLALNYFHITL